MSALDALPMTSRTHVIGGVTFTLDAASDQDALLAATANHRYLPFGLMLWESGIVLGEVIDARAAQFSRQRVLELGCGVGLSGIVAAHLGADVVAVDVDPLAVELSAKNARNNGVECRHRAYVFDWHAPHALGSFDVVIAADVVYDAADHGAVVALLLATLKSDGRAVITDPQRSTQAAFVARLANSGFAIDVTDVTTPDLKSPGRSLPISVLSITRR